MSRMPEPLYHFRLMSVEDNPDLEYLDQFDTITDMRWERLMDRPHAIILMTKYFDFTYDDAEDEYFRQTKALEELWRKEKE